MVTILQPLTAEGKIALLSEYLDISLDDIQKISLDRKEAERLQKIADQLAKDQETERRQHENRRKDFAQNWQDGKIIVRADGKLKDKPSPLCKEGTPNMDDIEFLTFEARTKLFHHGKPLDNRGNILPAATISRSVKCSCGEEHQVTIFVTNTK